MAVVIGAAFGAIVASLVENLITPLIGAIGGQPDLSRLAFEINGSRFGDIPVQARRCAFCTAAVTPA